MCATYSGTTGASTVSVGLPSWMFLFRLSSSSISSRCSSSLLQQRLDQPVQLVAVVLQQLVGPLVGLAQELLHFLVDDLRPCPR